MRKIAKTFLNINAQRFTWLLMLITLSVFVGAASCTKTTIPEAPSMEGHTVVLDKSNVEMVIGDQTVIELGLDNGNKFVKPFQFSSSDPEVAAVERASGYSVRVLAKKIGNAVVTFTSEDNTIELKANITVKDLPWDGVTRILAIGNSFSEDAIETFLHPIATAAGERLIVANLYIGGSSLEDHLQNANENKKVYSYRKISLGGNKTTTDNISIEDALKDERWDFISFQQVSQNSGLYPTYEASLPGLVNYVKSKVAYSRTKYILHQPWAYAQSSNHFGFANYENDQIKMYNAIADATQKAATLMNADLVVPAGTAIQNARTSFWGDNFTRDGYHLNLAIGRYTAAAAWYEAIFGKSVIGNTFNPQLFGLSALEMELAQHAAHEAVQKPYQVTNLTDFQTVDLVDLTKPVLVDVAQRDDATGWNGLTSPEAGFTIPYLRNIDGQLTKARLTTIERFNNINSNGTLGANPWQMPPSVAQHSFFGNTKTEFGGLLIKQSVIRISNLDKGKKYDLCFFGSRCCVGDFRETKFTSRGANEATAYLNADNNISNTACTPGIQPDADGNIFITVTAGERNGNGTGFYYLTAFAMAVAQ